MLSKETEMIEKYQNLAEEMKKLLNMSVAVIYVVMFVQNWKRCLEKIGTVVLQKMGSVYSAIIFWKVLRSPIDTMSHEQNFLWLHSMDDTNTIIMMKGRQTHTHTHLQDSAGEYNFSRSFLVTIWTGVAQLQNVEKKKRFSS